MANWEQSKGWILAGTAYGLMAAALNVFALVPVYGSLTLHFGLALAFLCLLTHGLRAALLAAVFAGLGLFYAFGDEAMIVLPPMEVGLIGLLVRRRIPLILSALIFWLVVGLPLSYLEARYGVKVPADYFTIAVIKQAINGLFNASVASALFLAFSHFQTKPKGEGQSLSFFQQVFSLVLVCVVLPSLLLSLILSNQSVETFSSELRLRLSQQAREYGLHAQAHVLQHRDAIALLANLYRQANSISLEESLSSLQQQHPGFLTLVYTDSLGQAIFAVPESFRMRLNEADENERNVSDRQYFQKARDSGKPFVSGVLQGRGLGDDPIVVVSAPLFEENGRFAGIVQGALNLHRFARFETRPETPEEGVIILDKDDRVVYSSPSLGLGLLSPFEPEISTEYTSVREPQFIIGGERFLYESFETDQDWRVYALYRSREINELIRRDMLLLGVSLAGLLALFLFAGRAVARAITRPIADLTRQVGSAEPESIRLADSGWRSREVHALAETLEQARRLSEQFRQRLEGEVEYKTKELEKANQALAKIASEDPLTRLLNRRGFRIYVNSTLRAAEQVEEPVALALIDLDYFKTVNDEYGHPGGDECLRRFAHMLQDTFTRTSDIVARTGGEEFAVLAAGEPCREVLKRLEQLREQLAHSDIPVNKDASVRVTFSAGFLCKMVEPGTSLDEMFEEADALLYRSKREGRNRITSRLRDSGAPFAD